MCLGQTVVGGPIASLSSVLPFLFFSHFTSLFLLVPTWSYFYLQNLYLILFCDFAWSYCSALSQFLVPSSPSSDVNLFFTLFLLSCHFLICDSAWTYCSALSQSTLYHYCFFFFFHYFCYCFISLHFISSMILRGHTVPHFHCSYLHLRLTSCNYFTSSCSCAR